MLLVAEMLLRCARGQCSDVLPSGASFVSVLWACSWPPSAARLCTAQVMGNEVCAQVPEVVWCVGGGVVLA
jgi:hypothetical protein